MSFFSFDSFQLLANSAETCNIRDQVLHIVAATGGNRDQQVQNSTCHPDWLIAVAVSSFTRFSLDRLVFFVQNEKSFEIHLNIVHPDDRVRYISLWIMFFKWNHFTAGYYNLLMLWYHISVISNCMCKTSII